MKLLQKLLFACVPLAALAACGGGDTEDRLDVADPNVRFVNVTTISPQVTLYRGTMEQGDAKNVEYGIASDYFDVDSSVADWSVKTVPAGTQIGSVSIDAQRGTKYTIVAQDTSATTSGTYLITDPYNKSLNSDRTRLRVMNGAYNTDSVDIYMTATADIATATPRIAGTAANASGPAPGQDAISIDGGTYQLTVTAAGTKTVLFKGEMSFGSNKDLLLVAVPATAVVPGSIRMLLKAEGEAGATEIPAAS